MRFAILIVVLFLAGCAMDAATPAKQAVAEAPCKAAVPKRPVFPADTLTGSEDIWTIGTTLWADRKARKAYELELEKIAEGCTRPPQL